MQIWIVDNHDVLQSPVTGNDIDDDVHENSRRQRSQHIIVCEDGQAALEVSRRDDFEEKCQERIEQE